MIPPTTIGMSAFSFFSASISRSQMLSCAPERIERPITSTSSCAAAAAMAGTLARSPVYTTSMPASRGALARRLRRRAGDLHLRLGVGLAHRAELVDADDRHLALLHRPLVLVGALRDALLHVSAAQCLDEAAPLVDLRHHGADRLLHPVGERLDEPA